MFQPADLSGFLPEKAQAPLVKCAAITATDAGLQAPFHAQAPSFDFLSRCHFKIANTDGDLSPSVFSVGITFSRRA
jgi:hypothetical protein